MNIGKRGALAAAVAVGALVLTGCGALSTSDETPSAPAIDADWEFPAVNRLADGTTQQVTYVPIAVDKVTQKWNLCVLFPHMKDAFWVSANYGSLIEAQRDGAQYNLFEAGGYPNIDKQISQFQDCINGGYDAIVVGANNGEALCPQIEAALAKEIPVVDLINGISCPSVNDEPLFSHAAISYARVSEVAASWLVENAPDGANVGFFPGPEGASWSDSVVDGWLGVTDGTAVKTVDTRRGDYGVEIQQGYIQDSLTANPEIDWIYGLSAAAQGAINVLRQTGADVQILAGNSDPVIYQAVLDGSVAAAGTDWAVIQARFGIDQAIRLLEGEDLEFRDVGPEPAIYTKETAADLEYDLLFGPKSFEPTYTWSP